MPGAGHGARYDLSGPGEGMGGTVIVSWQRKIHGALWQDSSERGQDTGLIFITSKLSKNHDSKSCQGKSRQGH